MYNENESIILSDRFQSILNGLTRCKIDFISEKEENIKLREINAKLEVELKETRELERSHRQHLVTSREMVGNLQETVSKLVYLKRDVMKLKDEIAAKDAAIAAAETEKGNILKKNKDYIAEIRRAHERDAEELATANQRKLQQFQQEYDTQIAQFTCLIEEQRSKIKELEAEHKDKMNVVVLEYEEKIQRGAAQVTQLQEQLSRQAARTDANIDAYRRRLEELEEKLKQSQFKQYLAQSSYASEYESQVERPYSVERDPYMDACSEVDVEPVIGSAKMKPPMNPVVTPTCVPAQNRTPRQGISGNTLQVMYYDNKPNNVAKNPDKNKGQFNITKKRKLYSDKDYQNF